MTDSYDLNSYGSYASDADGDDDDAHHEVSLTAGFFGLSEYTLVCGYVFINAKVEPELRFMICSGEDIFGDRFENTSASFVCALA